MRAQGASETWLDWLFAQEGRIGRTNAAAGFAVESTQHREPPRQHQGRQRPASVRVRVGARPPGQVSSPVVGSRRTAGGVTVGYADRSGRHEVRADRCVCALPFAPLRRVSTRDAFSHRKLAAIHKLKYMAAARCYFQTRTRFWEDDPLGPLGGLNLVGTDTMAGRVWNTSSQQADPDLGMVHAYMFDTEALEFASHGRPAGRRHALACFSGCCPASAEQVVGVAHKAWQEDPWAGGGWGWTQPGELRWMLPAMREPEGRVHFAGEHTSLWIAYMNGALESAERVVQEIDMNR